MNSASPRYTMWFVPFGDAGHAGASPCTLQSPYEGTSDGNDQFAANGQPFTVSLKSVYFAAKPPEGLFGLVQGGRDILIASTTALGTQPRVQRVHYYTAMSALSAGAPLSDFLSDTIYLCNDYSGTDRLWLQLQVYDVPADPAQRNSVVQTFQGLAEQFDSIFPVAIPYTMVATGLVTAINTLIQQLNGNMPLLDTHVGLVPQSGRFEGLLRGGMYVLFAQPIDGTQYALQDNSALVRKDGAAVDVAYAVMSISFDIQPGPDWDDKVNAQRVATLLTGMQPGGNPDPTQATLHFLSDTLSKYSDWTALERYRNLSAIPVGERTAAQKAQMATIAQNPNLQPYLQLLPSAVPSLALPHA